jgi:hypothetical protein
MEMWFDKAKEKFKHEEELELVLYIQQHYIKYSFTPNDKVILFEKWLWKF